MVKTAVAAFCLCTTHRALTTYTGGIYRQATGLRKAKVTIRFDKHNNIKHSFCASLLQLPREHNKQAKAPPLIRLGELSPQPFRTNRSLKRVGNNLEASHWTMSSIVEIEASG